MRASNVILGVVTVISLLLNFVFYNLWRADEAKIVEVRASLVQSANAYRAQLIQLKTEHPIIFSDLKIPPQLN